MASILKKASSAISNSRTAMLTAPLAKQTIIINGLISNIDSTNKNTHFVTVEIHTSEGGSMVYRTIVKDAPVPYGGSLELPKIVMGAGDVLHCTASSVSVLAGYISYVEKD